MNLQTHPLAPAGMPPENVTMTLEEFLVSDVDGYEYVKGELIPMAAPSAETRASWFPSLYTPRQLCHCESTGGSS